MADAIHAEEMLDLAAVICLPYNKEGRKVTQHFERLAEGKPVRQADMFAFAQALKQAKEAATNGNRSGKTDRSSHD